MKTPARSSSRNWLRTGALCLFALPAAGAISTSAQTGEPIQLLDWVEVKSPGGLNQQLHALLSNVTSFFVRVTSPDVPRESRRVWKMSVDGSSNCLLNEDTGVRYPRWGSAGYVLYLQEADTNHDGRMDFNDDFLIRIAPVSGGAGKTVAQGKSAVWSPDGRYIGFVRDGKILFATAQGEILSPGNSVPAGKIVAANGRNPNATHHFWSFDAREGSSENLPDDLARKYLWIGSLSPSGTKIIFANTMENGLEVQDAQNQASVKEIAHGEYHVMDPAWSPDEKEIVYISDRPATGAPCGNDSNVFHH
jgi:dipeptidyl aminopeptidase/acylaminoacyl peptidase